MGVLSDDGENVVEIDINTVDTEPIAYRIIEFRVDSPTIEIEFKVNGKKCMVSGAPETWNPDAAYQATIINDCVKITEFT